MQRYLLTMLKWFSDTCASSPASCSEGSIRICSGTDTNCVISDADRFLIDNRLSVGRVEVCSGGRYGTVCDDHWTNQAASVVCRQLGFSPYGTAPHSTASLLASLSVIQTGAIGLTDAQFAEENNPIAITSINCAGTEERVVDCNRNTGVLSSCDHFEDAGVVCQGSEYPNFLS